MDNGICKKETEEEGKYSLMDRFTKDIGKMISLTAKAEESVQMVKYTKDSGSKAKYKERECSSAKMVHLILENGLMAGSMDMVTKNGVMAHNTKAILLMD